MERRTIRHSRRVHIAKREHVVKAIFPPIFVAAAPAKLCRVLEGAEEHVPDRQVGEVVCVMAKLMVHAVRLRPLEKVTQPLRGFDVPVVKEFAHRDQQRVIRSGNNITAKERVNDQTAEEGVEQDLDWMLVKAGQDFKSTRGVMNLVQDTPEKLRFMAIAMPPVENEGGENINNDGRIPGSEIFAQVKERPMPQPTIPGEACQPGKSELNGVDQNNPGPPRADARKFHGRPEFLRCDTTGGNRKDQDNHGCRISAPRSIALIDKYCYANRLNR